MANTITYKEEFSTVLQERLEQPKFWNTLGDARYTPFKVFNNPYKNSATATSYTRGAQFTYTDVTMTNETLDIVLTAISPEFIDLADLAQNGYNLVTELAADQGDILMDEVEQAFFTTGLAGAGNTSAWVAGSYITGVADVRSNIVVGKGLRLLERKGGSILMSPAAYALLVVEAQDKGVLTFSDSALKEGTVAMVGGFKIYESNLIGATNKAIGFVNKSITVGILNTTFGLTVVDDKNPDNRSAVGYTSRIDYGIKVFNVNVNMVVDITAALS
jgi:hypothetical protein